MKKFLRTMLAVICGLLIFNLLGFFLIMGLAVGSDKSEPVPMSGILKMDLSKFAVTEQPKADDVFSHSQLESVSLRQAVAAINKAATDPGVSCIYLKADAPNMGTASMTEIRKSLVAFRQSGKPLVAYTENPTTASMYLGSAADKIYMTTCQGGNPSFLGLSSQMLFLSDLLDKLGIKVQLIRHGKYKSAGEMYIRNSASPENLHQTQTYVNSLWGAISADIAQGRGISVEALNGAIDNLDLCLPEDFLKFGLVDELLDRCGLEEKLAMLGGVDSYDKVSFIPFAGYARTAEQNNFRSRKRIAIIYADGQIVDGLDYNNVDGDRFAATIEKVCKDTTVKAVVLRVNSPGGSVVASEKIKNELDRLGERVPVIASYGDYAASGGYWISNGADKIYCDETTITGSIGVFGMIPDASKLIKETAHIGIQAVNSNAHGDMFSLTRPMTAEELAFMQRSIETIYTKFITIVAEGRNMTVEAVDEIAQGRVWAGTDALNIGLVDEIGTLEDALKYAALSAGDENLASWNIVEYPKAMTFAETLTSMLQKTGTDDFSVYTNWFNAWKEGKGQYAFALIPYSISIR